MHAHRIYRTLGYKVLLLLAAGFFALGTTQANSQMVLLAGGNLVSSNSGNGSDFSGRAGMQLGGRFWLTDIFQLQGVLAYQDLLSAEASLLVRPFTRGRTLDPYVFVGFGSFLDADEERAVVPIGAGVEYRLNNHLGLLFEVAGRWTLSEHRTYEADLDFGLVPSFGVSYRLNRLARPGPREGVILTDAEPLDDTVEDAEDRPAGVQDDPVTQILQEMPAGAEDRPAGVQDDPVTLILVQQGDREVTVLVVPDLVEADTVLLPIKNNMVLVPDGTFILGLTDEDPLQLQTAGLRRITLSQFYIDQYEVSNTDYLAFLDQIGDRPDLMPDTTMQQTGNRFSWSEYFRSTTFANHPVVGVTHAQATQYCTFYDKRLPTEAEWEYAARAGHIGGVYPWFGLEPRDKAGNFLANYNPGRGGYAADGYAFTSPVDALPHSRWGLYNVSGNVAEWAQDTFHPSYSTLADFNPLVEDSNEARRIVRGGSWASDAFYIGVGVRDAQPANEASPYVGLRCVQDITEAEKQQ